MSKSIFTTIIIAGLVGGGAGGGVGYFIAGSGLGNTEETVRSALLARPEIVEEAFYALQEKRQAEAEATNATALAQAQGALYGAKEDPILGTDDAPFVLVEFFDYNCGYCKTASKWVQTALAENSGKVKIIMKDYPILEGRSEGSRESSAAAWAARLQGQDKYQAFHFALMDARGGFDSARIDDIAAQSGIDVARMRTDMKTNAEAFAAMLEENFSLASQLGIEGTPAFVTSETVIAGAETEMLQSLLEAALEEVG